jgi:S1-C subfamily serine protease
MRPPVAAPSTSGWDLGAAGGIRGIAEAPTPGPPKHRSRPLLTLLVILLVAVLGGGVGAAAVLSWPAASAESQGLDLQGSSVPVEGIAPVDSPDLSSDAHPGVLPPVRSGERGPVALTALNSILPATVTVLTPDSVGTGVVVSAAGEIVTNAHVVEGSGPIRVLLHEAVDAVPARLVGLDTESDIALLRLELVRLEGQADLVPATFAASVSLGEEVVAVGYALGLEGEPTVTRGIVSATRRTILVAGGVLTNLLQTDTPISSGNSGGPLVNVRGEVVGINTAVFRGDTQTAASNIGFAVRTETVLSVVEMLRNGEVRQPAFLGIMVDDRDDGGRGGRVIGVNPRSPAEKAGLVVGDVVLRVGGVPIAGRSDLVGAIRTMSPGDRVELEVVRQGERQVLIAVLSSAG